MIELPLVFVGGLLGSSHCIGMCGPLALVLGSNRQRPLANLGRQLVFSTGRIFTYAVLGAAAGFAGLWLRSQPSMLVNIQAALAILAGLVLIALGLTTAGWLPWGRLKVGVSSCFAATWLKTFLTAPDLTSVFLAGVFTGFIPCGLVYAFLAVAASTGSLWFGAATMAAFGLGTVPLMTLTGCGGSLLSLVTRTRVLRVAALCVVATGLVSLARGAGYLDLLGPTAAGCLMCQ